MFRVATKVLGVAIEVLAMLQLERLLSCNRSAFEKL
jgi:hypothetical protein